MTKIGKNKVGVNFLHPNKCDRGVTCQWLECKFQRTSPSLSSSPNITSTWKFYFKAKNLRFGKFNMTFPFHIIALNIEKYSFFKKKYIIYKKWNLKL